MLWSYFLFNVNVGRSQENCLSMSLHICFKWRMWSWSGDSELTLIGANVEQVETNNGAKTYCQNDMFWVSITHYKPSFLSFGHNFTCYYNVTSKSSVSYIYNLLVVSLIYGKFNVLSWKWILELFVDYSKYSPELYLLSLLTTCLKTFILFCILF